MIRIVVAGAPLTAAERYGLDVLVDLSRLIVLVELGPARGGGPAAAPPDVVSLQVPPGGADDQADSGASPSAAARMESPIAPGDGTVIVPRSLLRAIVEVAGAGVEQHVSARDRHGRVPSADNPVVAAGREREPIVSLAAASLRSAVARAAGRRPVLCVAPWPDGHRWCAAFSHDLDVVAGWPLFSALRVAELLRKRQVALAELVVRAALRESVSDPVWRGVRGVLDADRQAAVRSTWFLLCGTPTLSTFRRGDLAYRPESRAVRRIIESVRGDGHEIGLHGSFATMDEPGVFASQRSRLETISAESVVGVRQHFLRMRPGVTQREMTRAGFAYDATYGFPDRNGFRLGVADVIAGWDDREGRESELWEVPLTWMDRAQSKYQGIEDPARWIDDALALAVVCQRFEGAWIGLWHPNLTSSLGYPDAPAAYERLLDAIMAKRPFNAPLDQVVAWRRLRRAVRLIGAPGRDLFVTGPPNRQFDVGIEDGGGRAITQLPRGAVGDRAPVPL